MQRASIRYHDFDLVFERSLSGYDVHVTQSPAGTAEHRFPRLTELQEERVRTFRAVVGGHRPGKRRIDSPEMDAAKRLGGDLFSMVFDGPVEECFRTCMSKIWAESGTGLRVRLHMRGAPELADLPWEFLYDARENQFLSLSVSTPLVRYLEISRPVQPLTVEPPLRVLVMISNPSDIDDLDVEEEWRQLRESVSDLSDRGLVTFDRLAAATLEELQRQLRREEYHVFHYIGHAGFDDQADDGVLVLENERGRSRQVNAERLGNILHDEASLRLAILNACEGARSSRKDPFSGLAQSLVQKGVPAVIAMQFEISDQAAITMSHEFYRALGEGYPADAALAEARKMVSNRNELEWGTPVLFLRSPDAVLFDVAGVNEASRTRAQVHRLVGTAEDAALAGNWAVAIEGAEGALALDATSVAAAAVLGRAREGARAEALRIETERSAEARRETERSAQADEARRQEEAQAEAYRLEQEAAAARAAEAKRHESEAAQRDAEQAERRREEQARLERDRQELREREERILAGLEKAAGVKPKKSILKRAALGVGSVLAALSIYVASQEMSGGESMPFVESDFIAVPVGEVDGGAVGGGETDPGSTAGEAVDVKSAAPVAAPPPAVPEDAQATARERDRVSALHAEIRAFLGRAGEAEIQAFRALDPSFLYGTYDGAALEMLVAHMGTLTANGVHQASTLLDRVVHGIDVASDGASARVRMTETWSTEFHQNGTDLCLGRIPSSEAPQTLTLRRRRGLSRQGGVENWVIVAVEAPANNLEPEPCFGPVP